MSPRIHALRDLGRPDPAVTLQIVAGLPAYEGVIWVWTEPFCKSFGKHLGDTVWGIGRNPARSEYTWLALEYKNGNRGIRRVFGDPKIEVTR